MARKDENLDVSTVVFETEILYNGEKYDKPLYKEIGAEEFAAAFENRFEKPIHKRSNRSRIRSDLIRMALQHSHNYSIFEELKDEIMDPQRYETELDRAICFRDEINAMRELYYACLDCGASEQPEIEQVFQLLFLSEHYYSRCKANVESEWSYFSSRVLEQAQIARQKEKAVEKYLSNLSGIKPMCTIYDDFCQTNEETIYQYEYRFNDKFNTNIESFPKELPLKQSTKMNCYLYFWQNQKFSSELRALFWNYCRTLPPTDIQDILFHRNIKAFSELILDVLDRRLEEALENTKPKLCTKDATIRWEANYLVTAEYLSLYRELVQRKKYRICPICGSLFELSGRYKTKAYCDLHNANQIQYYNRIRNHKKKP